MKKEHSKTIVIAVGVVLAALLIGLIAAFISIRSVGQQNAAIQSELTRAVSRISQQVQDIKEANEKQYSDKNFNEAVARAINAYGQQRQEEIRQAKLQEYANAPDTLIEGKRIYGNPQARFTLVGFSDIECPYCKRFHPTPKELVDGSNGLVNWEWRHLPLEFHNPVAKIEAHAAECVGELAGNKAFWAYISDMFAHTAGNGQGANNLLNLAVDLGVDAQDFKECMQSARHEERIDNDIAMAVSLGISGTPATILTDNYTGNTQLLGGARPKEAFITAMQNMQQAANEKD